MTILEATALDGQAVEGMHVGSGGKTLKEKKQSSSFEVPSLAGKPMSIPLEFSPTRSLEPGFFDFLCFSEVQGRRV